MSILATIFGEAANVVTGGLAGGILRLVPEVMRLFTAKADRDHEFRMAQLQRDMAKDGSEQRIRETEAAGAVAVDARTADAYIEAIKAQGQKTGIWVADLLNALVRPVTTYYFLFLFGAYKAALFSVMVTTGTGLAQAVMAMWTPDDQTMLSGLMSFWFVGRTLDKRAGR